MKKIIEEIKFCAEFAFDFVLLAAFAACGISATATIYRLFTETMP